MMSTNKTNLDTPAHVGQAQEKRPKVQRTEKSVWLIDVPSEGQVSLQSKGTQYRGWNAQFNGLSR